MIDVYDNDDKLIDDIMIMMLDDDDDDENYDRGNMINDGDDCKQ